MKTTDLDRALALARSRVSLNMADTVIFDGFGLPDFEPVTCTVEALAALVRWQCVCFDGSIDAGALRRCCGRPSWQPTPTTRNPGGFA